MKRRDKKSAGGFLRAVAVLMVMVLIVSGMPMDVNAQTTDTYYNQFRFANMYTEEDEAIVREAMKQFYAYDSVNDKIYHYVDVTYEWDVYEQRNVWSIKTEGIPKGIRVDLHTIYGYKEMAGSVCIENPSHVGVAKLTTLERAYLKDGENIIQVVYDEGSIWMDDDELETPVKEGYVFAGWLDAEGDTVSFPVILSDGDVLYASWALHQHDWNTEKWSYDNSNHWHECVGEGTCDITSDWKKDGYASHTMGEWVEVVEATAYEGGIEVRKCTTCDYKQERETDTLPDIVIHFYNCDEESQVDAILPLFYVTNTNTGTNYYFEKFQSENGEWNMRAFVPRNSSLVLQTTQGVVLDCVDSTNTAPYYNAGLYTAYFKNGDEIVDTIYSWTNPDYGYIPEEAVSVPEKAGYVFNGWKLEDGSKITFPVHPYYTDGWVGYTLNAYADWIEHDHDFTGREEVAEEPTCTDEGVRRIYCAKDGCSKYIEEAIDKIPHSYKTEWEYDLAYHYHTCEACGVHEEDMAHEMGLWMEVSSASFTQDGTEKRECTTCDYEETRRIPKLSESHVHDFAGREEIIDEPTCTEEGLKKVYCTEPECGASLEVPIMMTEHIYGSEWEYDGEAHYRICEVCGSRSDEHQHQMGDGVIVKEATEAEDGMMEWKCTDCGYTISKAVQYVPPKQPEEETTTQELKEEETTANSQEPTLEMKPIIKEEPVVEQVPYTGDTSPVQMYATLAMIAGFTYVLCMFTSDLFKMSEETKEHIIKKLIRWGKRRNVIIRAIAVTMMFVVLVYYHAIGKKIDVDECGKVEVIK